MRTSQRLPFSPMHVVAPCQAGTVIRLAEMFAGVVVEPESLRCPLRPHSVPRMLSRGWAQTLYYGFKIRAAIFISHVFRSCFLRRGSKWIATFLYQQTNLPHRWQSTLPRHLFATPPVPFGQLPTGPVPGKRGPMTRPENAQDRKGRDTDSCLRFYTTIVTRPGD